MSQPMTVSSLKSLVRFPFQGPDAKNRLVVGSALTLAGFFIPVIPNIITFGYSLRILRQTTQGEEPTLSAWDNWGQLFVDGLRALVVILAYTLPGIIVLVGGYGLYIASILAASASTGASRGGDAAALAALAPLGGMVVMFFALFVGMLLLYLGYAALSVAGPHFALKDQVAAAFRVREWWAVLRANWLGFAVAWVVVAGLAYVLTIVTMLLWYSCVLCCLVPFVAAPLGFYVQLLVVALFGQAYHEGAAA